MFLKIWHDGSWRYYGDILDFASHGVRKRGADELSCFHSVLMSTPFKEDEELACRSFWLKRRSGEELTILTDSMEAYLCNANGDTIDKFICR